MVTDLELRMPTDRDLTPGDRPESSPTRLGSQSNALEIREPPCYDPTPARWLVFGQEEFSDEPTRAWFFHTPESLVWYAETTSAPPLRFETVVDDEHFLGDNVMALVIAGGAGAVYRLMANPIGTLHHARLRPEPDIEWNPGVTIETDRRDTHWRLLMAIPWTALGFSDRPSPGTTLQVNLLTAWAIAPRRGASWAYWSAPFVSGTSLAPVRIE